MDLAGGRGHLELTAYNRQTHDALVNQPLPPSVGGGPAPMLSRRVNLSSVRNRGFELTFNTEIVRAASFTAGGQITGTVNANKLLSTGPGVILQSPTAQEARQAEGYPLFGVWGRTVESFSDANHNGIIEPSEIVLAQNHFIGSTFPLREWTGAPYLNLFGDRLRLNAHFQYRGGMYMTNLMKYYACLVYPSCRAVNDPTASLAEQADAIAMSMGALGPALEPASYAYFRELSARLVLPRRVATSLQARSAELMLAGRNLAVLWTQGHFTAPESDWSVATYQRRAGASGPPTYLVARVNLNY